ncbi:hypothetical protein EHQ47_16930 [Leptospira bourretii]|uniref:hypothetical protein n=1 Tax=Leptospira bourretii TaxID=2484962 RepID=UPI0010911AF6|nr:hypothetical protein [Leptospira bourretii]TGL19781.1 hypothetical protein EHQ47_16930 [Leptospira bourretii]
MHNTLFILADIQFILGIIGYSEYEDRIKIAHWIYGDIEDDPRSEIRETNFSLENNPDFSEKIVNKMKEEGSIEFKCFGIWIFTKADPDPYPSVPHGHYKDQNKSWPKLNPYTGKVFNEKDQEDKSLRLTKEQLKILWSDEKFKSFCREMIVWYLEEFPLYDFPVRIPLRFPKYR